MKRKIISVMLTGTMIAGMLTGCGSDIQIATNPGDTGSYYPGSNGQKGYNLLHLNALYEIDYHIYADSIANSGSSDHAFR